MDFANINFARLLYLILILAVLLTLFLVSNKKYLNRNLQNLSIWLLIFFGAVAAYYVWDDLKFDIQKTKQKIEHLSDGNLVIRKAKDGHFYLPMELNEQPIIFLVDTGATRTVLSKEDFARLGERMTIFPTMRKLETANGSIFADELKVKSVTVFGHQLGSSDLLVVSKNFEGPKISLLGLDLLNKFPNFEISKNSLTLQLR